MNRLAAVAVIVAAGTLAGCGGTSTASHAASASSHRVVAASTSASHAPKIIKASNPVTLLRKIDGCKIDPSEHVGQQDAYGNWYADCKLGVHGWTDVTAYTWSSTQTGVKFTSDDSHKIITGKRFVVEITGDWSSYSKNIDAATIARQIGGVVQKP